MHQDNHAGRTIAVDDRRAPAFCGLNRNRGIISGLALLCFSPSPASAAMAAITWPQYPEDPVKQGLADLAVQYLEILTLDRVIATFALLLLLALAGIAAGAYLFSYTHSTLRSILQVWGGVAALFLAVPLVIGILFLLMPFQTSGQLQIFLQITRFGGVGVLVVGCMILYMVIFDAGLLRAFGQLLILSLALWIGLVLSARFLFPPETGAHTRDLTADLQTYGTTTAELWDVLRLRGQYSTRETFSSPESFRYAVRNLEMRLKEVAAYLRQDKRDPQIIREYRKEIRYLKARRDYLREIAPQFGGWPD